MEQHFAIRLAAAHDAAALLDIYAPYITDTAITFGYEVPAAEEFAARIQETLATHPYLVCERDGVPVGYAYAHRIRERAAYDWAAELSIYLAPAAQGQGVGTVLYQCLIDLLVSAAPARAVRLRHPAERKKSAPARKARLFARGRVARLGLEAKQLARRGAGLKSASARAAHRRRVTPFARLDSKKIQGCLQQYTDMLNNGGTELTWHFATF